MIKNQLSVHATAVQFNLPSLSTPLSWLKHYNHSGTPYPSKRTRHKMPQSKIKRILKTPNDELSHQDLLEKLSYLEAENAYLKKAEAFVQEQALKTTKKRNGSLN
jgi:transposase